MPIMRHASGRILRSPRGMVAGSSRCCCVASCCGAIAGTLYADTVWCGTNTITLNEVIPSPCASYRFWRGTGRFGGAGGGTAVFEVRCGSFVDYRYDACVGSFAAGTECEDVGGGGQWITTGSCDQFPFGQPNIVPNLCIPAGCAPATGSFVIRE